MKSCIKKGCGCLSGLLLLLCITCAMVMYMNRLKWSDEYGRRFTDVVYGNRKHNTYDLYLPKDAAQRDSLALILYVHGGSWLGGDKYEHHSDCYAWVQNGYATATMNYSLLNEEGVSIPTMLEEIDLCIQHIEGLASRKGARICQMAIGGTSAGGHLAMMYAYSRPHCLPLRFATIKVGPSDLRILFPYDGNAKAEDIEKFAFSCTGRHWDASVLTAELLDSIKLQASPIAYVTDSTALPAIFAYGGIDGIVRPENYRKLQAGYDSLGKPYSLIVFPNSGHFLISDKDCSERYDSTMNVYCKKYFGY